MTLHAKELERTFLAHQSNDRPFEEYDGKNWQELNHSINFTHNGNQYWVSRGSKNSKSREYLFFDTQSKWLIQLKQQALKICKDKSTSEALLSVNNIINRLTRFPDKSRAWEKSTLIKRLCNYLDQCQKSDGLYRVTMDELIDQKILVCRHRGPLAASIIAFLIENTVLPNGATRQYRSILTSCNEAHTWATYRDYETGNLWVVDPQWELLINCSIESDLTKLKKMYGDKTVERMIERSNKQDLYEPLLKKIEDSQYFPVTAQMSEGTDEDPARHLRLELGQNKNALYALDRAFSAQRIYCDVNYEKNHLVIDSKTYGIFSLNFERLKEDYDRFLLNECKDATFIPATVPSVPTPTAPAPVVLLAAEATEATPNAPIQSPPAPVVQPPVKMESVPIATKDEPGVEQIDPYSQLLEKFKTHASDFLTAKINEGTINNPGKHLRLIIGKEENKSEALYYALRDLGVKTSRSKYQESGVYFLVIKIEENINISSLNFAPLREKYHHFLNRNKSKGVEKSEPKSVTQAPIQSKAQPATATPGVKQLAAPVVKPSSEHETVKTPASKPTLTPHYDLLQRAPGDSTNPTVSSKPPVVSFSTIQATTAHIQQITTPEGQRTFVFKFP